MKLRDKKPKSIGRSTMYEEIKLFYFSTGEITFNFFSQFFHIFLWVVKELFVAQRMLVKHKKILLKHKKDVWSLKDIFEAQNSRLKLKKAL